MAEPSTKPKPLRPRMSLPARLGFSALFFGTAIFFAVQGDSILAAALAIIGIASFGGYRAGAAYIVGTLIAITVAIMLAPSIGVSQEQRFTQWFGTTGLTNRLLSIGTIGVLISFAVTMIAFTIAGLFLANRPRTDTVNRWIGFAIGGAEGVLVVMLFLGGLLIIEPAERQRADTRDPLDLRGQFVSKWILKITDEIHSSQVGPLLVANNPFLVVPQLNKVQEIQQSVQVLSNPKKIDELIHHPSIEKLQQRAEVQQAVDQLLKDPEVQRILQSGKRLDRAAAMTLMSHPAVLELIDQPGFVEEAYRVIKETKITTP